MPLFAIVARDIPDGLALRMATRETHLAYLAGQPVKIAGPLLDAAGEPIGSLLIVEAEDLDAAKAFSANDPYAQAGLFVSVEIRPYRLVIDRR